MFSWPELLIAAPAGFAAGVVAGLLASNRYALVARKDWTVVRRSDWDRLQARDQAQVEHENGVRDHERERGPRPGD
jgi:hypothetical protein